MVDKDYIEKLIKDHLKEYGLFQVDIVVRQGSRILVEIDSMNGVRIEDCVRLSRFIESNFDRDKEDFQLDVSSAGIDQAFKVPQQYTKNIGREVEIVKTNGQKVNGMLVSFENMQAGIERVIIVKEDKKKRKETVRENIPTNEIKTTKVSISFK